MSRRLNERFASQAEKRLIDEMLTLQSGAYEEAIVGLELHNKGFYEYNQSAFYRIIKRQLKLYCLQISASLPSRERYRERSEAQEDIQDEAAEQQRRAVEAQEAEAAEEKDEQPGSLVETYRLLQEQEAQAYEISEQELGDEEKQAEITYRQRLELQAQQQAEALAEALGESPAFNAFKMLTIKLIADNFIQQLADYNQEERASLTYSLGQVLLNGWSTLWYKYGCKDFQRYEHGLTKYEIRYPRTTRYSLSLRGVCEEDIKGFYYNRKQCRDAHPNYLAPSYDELESTYIIFSYDPLSARALAPSDQRAIIRRITGNSNYSASSYEVLGWLARENTYNLYYQGFREYVLQSASQLDVVYLELMAGATTFPVNWLTHQQIRFPNLFARSFGWHSGSSRLSLMDEYGQSAMSDYQHLQYYLIYSLTHDGVLDATMIPDFLRNEDSATRITYYSERMADICEANWQLLFTTFGPPEYFSILQEIWQGVREVSFDLLAMADDENSSRMANLVQGRIARRLRAE